MAGCCFTTPIIANPNGTHDIVLEVLLRLLILQLDGLHPLDVEQAVDEDLRRLTQLIYYLFIYIIN